MSFRAYDISRALNAFDGTLRIATFGIDLPHTWHATGVAAYGEEAATFPLRIVSHEASGIGCLDPRELFLNFTGGFSKAITRTARKCGDNYEGKEEDGAQA